MPIDRDALTPQQRLAISRRALVRHLRGESDPVPEHADSQPALGTTSSVQSTTGHAPGMPWLSMVRSLAERWWRRHPANAMGQLARPLLDRYARDQPAKLLAIAAGTGALLVLVKPWRLLSVGAVVAALMKSSDIADMVTTLMHKKDA